MKLSLFHGRDDPAQEMDDWGYIGPVLEDVLYMHGVYQSSFTVGFLNDEAAKAAQEVTGWSWFDDRVLEIELHDDMIVTNVNGKKSYYGDWELMLWAPADKP